MLKTRFPLIVLLDIGHLLVLDPSTERRQEVGLPAVLLAAHVLTVVEYCRSSRTVWFRIQAALLVRHGARFVTNAISVSCTRNHAVDSQPPRFGRLTATNLWQGG